MPKLIVNPATGELDQVRTDDEITALASGGTPTAIVSADGLHKVTAEKTEMVSGGDTMIANNGTMQIASNIGPLIQILSDQLRISSNMSQRRERWKLNAITSSTTSLVTYFNKVTMASTGQSVQLFTGNNNGYYVLIYKDGGEPFDITLSGGTITGHGTSMTISEDGEAVLLHQADQTNYTVISHHKPSGGSVSQDELENFTGDQVLATSVNFLSISGMTVGKHYTISGRVRAENDSGTTTNPNLLHTTLPGVGGGSPLYPDPAGGGVFMNWISHTFVATATTMNFSVSFTGGGNMRVRHEMSLQEHNNMITTTKF